MAKLSAILGIVGVALLVLSFIPSLGTPTTLDQQATASPAPGAAYGRELFEAKGCATCHLHQDIAASGSFNIGPSLTTYQSDPGFLRRWLRNPQAIRPNTRMPNLNLRDDEIEALIAFLSENT